jgi:hypothetical protein
MYPAFDPAIDRYALTTSALTLGTVDVAATPGPGETVTIDGGSATHLTGVQPGQRVTVAFSGGTSPHTYTVVYLPAGFPKLNVTGGARASFPAVEPGLIALTPNTFAAGSVDSEAIVDRNGVPVYVAQSPFAADLKQQPNGEITVSRPTLLSLPNTGYSLVTLDDQFAESARRDVASPLTNTDMHDSIRLADGSTVLIGYEPRGDCGTGFLDATIQKQDPAGQVVFEWTSEGLEGEALNAIPWPIGALCQRSDYAHINSVVSVEDGDIIASFRHLSAAYRIATVAHDPYAKGEIIWKLGGRDSTFAFVDDPFPGGPCAQHTVSELTNGHILVFDNGTDGLCVNPADPTGGPIDRGATRVTEYALDLSATPQPTATLAWSYSPAERYSEFAGSARRLPRGNTLVDWASERRALATEVDAHGNTVWELKAADPPAGQERYASYRAELITALRPTATPVGPPDHATYVIGDVVPAGATCTDWRGDPLPSCTLVGLFGGRLDTRTAGSRTWQVVATDGAGNTTTAVRHYTVRSGRQPDGLIRKRGSSTWKGGNVHGAITDQTVRQRTQRGHTATSFWRVQNDGQRADSFVLLGTRTTARFRVRYFAGGTDVTRAVVAGSYRTATLAPGSRTRLRVEVTPTRQARVGDRRTATLRATSVAVGTATDRVATRVTARR